MKGSGLLEQGQVLGGKEDEANLVQRFRVPGNELPGRT